MYPDYFGDIDDMLQMEQEKDFFSNATVPDISDLYDLTSERVQEALDYAGEVHTFIAHGSCRHRVAFIRDGTNLWFVYIYDSEFKYSGPFDSLAEAADAASCYALLLSHGCSKL